ncbi:MAG: hypothetical protein PWP47_1422 [Synergistaceae bacterium]|nr:hypothetical protein [Synergistaceae bacterium]
MFSRKMKVCLAALGLLLAASAACPGEVDPVLVRITGSSVNIRSEASRTGKVIGRFAGGEPAVVLREKQDADVYPWLLVIARVPWPDGPVVEGWVYGRYAEPLPQGEWLVNPAGAQGRAFNAFFLATRERFGSTAEEAVMKLGKPLSRNDREVAGRHDPSYMVTFTDLSYPGLELRYFSTKDSRALIGARVTDGDYVLGRSVRLDASPREVYMELGPPLFQDGTVFGWSDEAEYATLQVTFSGGKALLADFSVEPD